MWDFVRYAENGDLSISGWYPVRHQRPGHRATGVLAKLSTLPSNTRASGQFTGPGSCVLETFLTPIHNYLLYRNAPPGYFTCSKLQVAMLESAM